LKGIDVNHMAMVRTNAGKFDTQNVGGVSYETLNQDSVTMFQALVADQLDGFLSTHPTFVGA